MGDRRDFLGDLIAMDETQCASTRKVDIPATAYVRPCAAIAPEALAGQDGVFLTFAERYGALTDELPLAGGSVMTTNAAGEIALISRLRAAAPWLEPAIASSRSRTGRVGRGSPGGRSASPARPARARATLRG